MKIKKTHLIATIMLVADFTSLGVQAAPRSTPVTVVNDATTPVPVTGAVEATVSGMVTVDNSPDNPVPVVIADPVQVNMGTNYRYIGNTIQGIQLRNVGLIGMNRLCHFDYGSEARMCTTKEFFQTPNPLWPGNTAWIHPSVGDPIYDSIAAEWFYMDYTGRKLRPGTSVNTVTCSGWMADSFNIRGATLHDFGVEGMVVVTTAGCSTTGPVACCTPQ